MISLSTARDLIANAVQPLPARTASLSEALGRILRQDVRAAEDLPAFDRSAMDGYALGLDDSSPRFRIVGEIQPGAVAQLKIHPGECARIFTGAPIPEGASQVLMQENARIENGFAIPSERTGETHIRKRGEDARQGELLLRIGTRIGAGEIALMAGLGLTNPLVSSAVRVIHLATGNEVVDPSQTPRPGQIRDTNSSLVAAFVRQSGGELVRQECVRDDFDLLLNTVVETGGACDLLLVSGGASVGDYDFGQRLLSALGFTIHFTRVSLRPGKPLIFGARANQAAFVLPGNPVSHFVTLHTAVRLAMDRMAGAGPAWPLIKLRLAAPVECGRDSRETFWPARASAINGELTIHPLRRRSSGDITGLIGANALLSFKGGAAPPAAGDMADVLLLETP